MLRRTHTSNIFILCIAITGSLALLVRNHYGPTMMEYMLIRPELYAEISTTTEQIPHTKDLAAEKLDLPILVYHIVRPSYPNDSAAVRALALTPETFDAELHYLKTNNYHVITFADLEDHYAADKSLPEKPIILSFDDGWKNQFVYALPILEKYRYPATFFVFTNKINHRNFLSWDNLKEMRAAGMTIGAHTRSHPYLTRIINPTDLWEEINGSKQILEKQLATPINEFAYPFGQYNTAVRDLVKKAGYRSARGDYESGSQTKDRLYELSALNAPTTMTLFEKRFPRVSSK